MYLTYINAAVLVLSTAMAGAQTTDWPYYGGDQGGMKYSTLTQVNKQNVSQLKLAWEWNTGETALKEYGTTPGVFEATPLVVAGTMYVVTGYNRVVALDPVSGRCRTGRASCIAALRCGRILRPGNTRST
jgi:quinoprotein glucose dehydrogenase